MTYALSNEVTRVLYALCAEVDSPVSLKVFLLLRSGQVADILSLRVDPLNYLSANDFLRDNACVEFLRKCSLDGVVSPKVRRQKAVDSFWESEHLCASTNVRLSRLLGNHSQSALDVSAYKLLISAKKWIANVLGPVPSILQGRFGPGATFYDRGRLTTVCDKMSSALTYTPGSEPLLHFVTETAWFRYGSMSPSRDNPFKTIRGNRFTTVPKDALKDRGICVEPSVNVFLQLDVGSALKAKLRRVGWDLAYAEIIHRAMAQASSRDGTKATIDLSSASDTVAYRLVEFLLPDDWFSLLCMLRSPLTQIDGKWTHLQKFSSMGNGFTFELETLIFASLCYAVGAGDLGIDFFVFGDDIIVPTVVAADLLALLSYSGFIPNERKTFVSGPFRESCGGDYFLGKPVRAYYLKKLPAGPQDWFKIVNGLNALGSRETISEYSFCRIAVKRSLDNIPSELKCLRGPQDLGDLVINDPDPSRWVTRWEHSIRYVKCLVPVADQLKLHHWRPSVVYAAALMGVIGSNGVTPNKPDMTFRVEWRARS